MASLNLPPAALWLAALGGASGVLSAYPPSVLKDITILEVPLYPGVLFGIVVGFGLYRWGEAGWQGVLLAIVAVLVAWIAAVRGFHLVTADATQYLYAGGLVAGAIGAAGTIAGSAIGVTVLRRPPALASTIAVGAVAGLLLAPLVDNGDQGLAILFAVWQAGVAASIGFALTRSP